MRLPNATIDALQQACHSLIPISVAMGVTVDHYSGDTLHLGAPLANNINHQQTAFGGSLFSLAAMTGWGLLALKTTELALDTNIVVAEGNVTYAAPVNGPLRCVCHLPEEFNEFAVSLTNTGKARLTLTLLLENNNDPGGEPAMTFTGLYIVRCNNPTIEAP